jgi:chromosome partitioning protein
LKGGSGKSTVAFNLAVWLLHRGVGTVAYDLDPQRTLSDVARIRARGGHSPQLRVFGTTAISGAQLQDHEEHVLVDVGASNMAAMQEAIRVADQVVVPVPPSQPDVWATQRFMRLVEKSLDGPVVSRVSAFVNRADTHHAVRESDEAAEAVRQLHGLNLLENRLCNRTIFRRSMSEGRAVFELWPSCKAAQELDGLAAELFEGSSAVWGPAAREAQV